MLNYHSVDLCSLLPHCQKLRYQTLSLVHMSHAFDVGHRINDVILVQVNTDIQ
jgi:hypothetical protein